MKGGSATKMILESMFAAALGGGDVAAFPERIWGALREYEDAIRTTYLHQEAIAGLVTLAGTAMQAGGKLFYLGTGPFGVAALVDASECPPTYNAGWDEVRAFLRGGYTTLSNVEGDLRKANPAEGGLPSAAASLGRCTLPLA
jgi:hypothetical protein